MNLDNIAIIEGLEEHVRANYLKFCKLDDVAECTEDSLRSPIELIGDLESNTQLNSRLDSILEKENTRDRDLFARNGDRTMMRTIV